MSSASRTHVARDRRSFVKGGLTALSAACVPALPVFAAEPVHDTTFAQDFDELWETLRDHYCFFESKSTDWDKVRELYRPRALAAGSAEAFEAVVGSVLSELYDAHTHLNDPPDGTRRWPLYDLMVERAPSDSRMGEVRIAAIQPDSSAADAGLHIGDIVTAVGGVPLADLVRDIAPKCLAKADIQADAWAINVAVAGQRGMPRTVTVRTAKGAAREVALPLKQRAGRPNVETRKLDGGLGYIAIHTFADTAVVDAFETALADLRDTRGLVLDVRGNGGGDTAVARPIMGRFISAPKPYATMRRREGKSLGAPWTESVDPRGPFTYIKPVVVLADHWSGSMAEGFPMGMRGIGRARIVGTPMMGLGAAVFSIRLDRTGVQAQYSGEPVYDVSGNARWTLRPDVAVPDGQDILAAGVADLQSTLKSAPKAQLR
ncbi:MAG TPA: S41 family peptidase [Steroidobacteraceae bacterium]|nr:S41 family peptidase [Steroidobacteraceae bacterium]